MKWQFIAREGTTCRSWLSLCVPDANLIQFQVHQYNTLIYHANPLGVYQPCMFLLMHKYSTR